MSKLLLKFSGKLLGVSDLEELGRAQIGRDRDCTICIDNIRCAPRHAEVLRDDQGVTTITALDGERYPLIINERTTKEHRLIHGDTMHFGDYILEYVGSSQRYHEEREASPDDEMDQRLWRVKVAEAIPGFVQILNGPSLGRIIKLTHEETPLKGKNGVCAGIRHHGTSYSISRVGTTDCAILLNDLPLAKEPITLKDGDVIQIDGLKMEFQQSA